MKVSPICDFLCDVSQRKSHIGERGVGEHEMVSCNRPLNAVLHSKVLKVHTEKEEIIWVEKHFVVSLS